MTAAETKLQSLLANIGFTEIIDAPERDLRDLGLDSLQFSLWVLEIERAFSVRVPPLEAKIDQLCSLSAWIYYLRGKGAAV